MRYLGIFLITLLGLSFAHADSPPDFPFVVATGKASEEVEPNEAEIHIAITSFSDSSEAALKAANTASDEVFQLLEKQEIPETALEARDLQKSTKRNRNSNHTSLEILGYEVSRHIIVKLDDLAAYAELMDGLVAVDNVSRVAATFDVKERDAIRERLVAKAGTDARHRARLMAESLGAEVHSVYAISQDSDMDFMFTRFGAETRRYNSLDAPQQPGSTIMFVPETIEVSQPINVVFRLED